jgi:hypothetical protein
MRKTITTIFLGLILTATAMAQTKEANPADVKSVDSIVKALYEVISGDAGQKRDWGQVSHAFFHSSARMIPTGKKSEYGRVRRVCPNAGRLH